VNSEIYEYRFYCNPELLYLALGNSHTKPKLKEMPAEAKQMLKWNHNITNRGVTPLLKTLPPSKLTTVDCIHLQENKIGPLEQNTTTSSSHQKFYYTGGFQNSLPDHLDNSHFPMPPTSLPPQAQYHMHYNCVPNMTVGTEWYPFHYSV